MKWGFLLDWFVVFILLSLAIKLKWYPLQNNQLKVTVYQTIVENVIFNEIVMVNNTYFSGI